MRGGMTEDRKKYPIDRMARISQFFFSEVNLNIFAVAFTASNN
jgi:hypothetical protein